MRNKSQLERALKSELLLPDETGAFVRDITEKSGRLVSLIGQKWSAPHMPVRQAAVEIPEPKWKRIFDVVANGQFIGDEWVHDDAVLGCAYAQRPDQSAVVLADAISTGKNVARLLTSSHRIAVVVLISEIDAPRSPHSGNSVESGEAEPGDTQQASGLRGLWGKAQATVQDVQGKLAQDKTSRQLLVLGDLPIHQLQSRQRLELGRSVEYVAVNRFAFVDGSVLDIRV